ncbi:hypothetical protein ACVDG5_016175 [Mesorhizobium sp. ORM6]
MTIKAIHTVVWAFFVGCILAIWVFALRGDYFHAALSIGVVLVEVLVLVLNGLQCPSHPSLRATPATDATTSTSIFRNGLRVTTS